MKPRDAKEFLDDFDPEGTEFDKPAFEKSKKPPVLKDKPRKEKPWRHKQKRIIE